MRTGAPPTPRPGRRRGARRVADGLVLGALLLGGCAVAPGGGGPAPGGAPRGADLPLPPAGYGTLHQDDVSISMRVGDLQLLVTPLMEPVLRATAPDTYRRLSGLAEAHGPAAARATGGGEPDLFLVSLFSDAQGTTFAPEDLNLIARGLRLRPDAIVRVTPGWGERRLRQRETEMAIYAFLGEVDLQSELVVVYQGRESTEWTVIRPRIQAELERARARAGDPGVPGQSSSSYLEILR